MQAGKQSLSASMTRQKPKVSNAIQEAVDAVRLKATGGKASKRTALADGASQEALQTQSDEAEAPPGGATMSRIRSASRLGPPLGNPRSS